MGSGALWWLCLAALLGPLLLCLRGQSAGVVALDSGLKRCEKFQTPQNSMCERCQKGWSGPYCTRVNIAYLRARRKRQKINDENLDECGGMRRKKVMQLRSLSNDMMIDIHLKETANLEQARRKLSNCSVADCGEEDWPSDLVLRWKCTASARRNPEDLTIQCNDGKQVKICEIRVYQCAEFWWDLENGCNQFCQCQDGANCNPWNGRCPPGKEIQVTTASGASAGAGQSSSTSTSLSSSPTPTTLSSSPTPTTLSSSPTPTTLSSSTTPTTLSSSTTPTTLGSSTSSDATTDREDEVVTTTLVISTTEEETSEAPTSTLTDEETSPPTAATTPVKSSATPEDKENEDEGGTGETNPEGGSGGNGGGLCMLTDVLAAVGTIVVLVAVAVVAGIIYKRRRQGARRPQAEENDGYEYVRAVDMVMNNGTPASKDDEDEHERRRQGAGRPQAEENDGYEYVREVDTVMNKRTPPASKDDEDEHKYANTIMAH